jgi:hypothetical protein
MPVPTFGLIMLVRDELDFIGPNIRFHTKQGFDRFAIVDNASTDGTREELEKLAETLPITIVDIPDRSFRQIEWATMLARTLQAVGADWAIHLDADEFLALGNGACKEAVAEIAHPILIRRENVLPRASDCSRPGYSPLKDSSLRVAKPVGAYPFVPHERQPAFPISLRNLPGKVLFPLDGLKEVQLGNHTVDHHRPTQPCPLDLLVRHYPVRRYDAFLRRLDHWDERFRLNPPSPTASMHVRRWLALRRHGRIERDYESFAIPDDQVRLRLEEGTLVEDFLGRSLS